MQINDLQRDAAPVDTNSCTDTDLQRTAAHDTPPADSGTPGDAFAAVIVHLPHLTPAQRAALRAVLDAMDPPK